MPSCRRCNRRTFCEELCMEKLCSYRADAKRVSQLPAMTVVPPKLLPEKNRNSCANTSKRIHILTRYNSNSTGGKTILIILILLLTAGCVAPDMTVPAIVQTNNAPTQPETTDNTNNNDLLRIGAFNIQVFGVTKASKPEVMDVLGKIIRTYDIVAIQEIRDKSQTSLPDLVDVVNSNGAQYDYVVSERLGRTISQEQYAYIYNTKTVKQVGVPHTYP